MNGPIWAPWRIEYILGDKPDGCIFCDKLPLEDGPDNLILLRSDPCMAVMNRYPYNNGHLMVMPMRHVADPRKLTAAEWASMDDLTCRCLDALDQTMHPDGFNIGTNMGKVAGAGIEEHLHRHIVPRWNGDTNFMPVLADMKVIPEHFVETYRKVREALER